MPQAISTQVYNLYGRFYDRFELLFKRRLAKALSALPFRHNDRVLDIGVGTGISLEFYPPSVHVTGIDLSEGMLAQAQQKLDNGAVRADCPREATKLIQGDALALPFPDKSFDIVTLSHVVTTVPDPERCLREAFRVARDGATILLVNHFRSPIAPIGWIESALDPVCRKLGWRSDLSLHPLLDSAGVEHPAKAHGAGFIFRIVYLKKMHNSVRMIAPEEITATPREFEPAQA